MKEEELGNLEQLFLQSCGDKLKENGGFTVRGELGVFFICPCSVAIGA